MAAPEGRKSGHKGKREHTWLVVLIVLGGVGAGFGSFFLIVDSAKIWADRSTESAEQASESGLASLDLVQARAQFGPQVAETVTLAIRVSAAAEQVSYAEARWTLDAGGELATIRLAATDWTALRDEDGSLSAERPLLNRGDLVEVTVTLAELGIQLAPGEMLGVVLQDGAVALEITLAAPENSVGRIVPLHRVA